MEQQLVFFDIDGTLVEEETGFIAPSTADAVRRARENGHLLFVNTGRTWPAIGKNVKKLGFDGMVCGCGTYIRYKEEILLKKELGHPLSREIARDLERWNIDAALEGNEYLYHRRRPALPFMVRLREEFGASMGNELRYWDDPDIHFDKLAVWLNPASDFPAFENKYRDRFDFIHRETDFYELVPKGYSKATGIAFLLEYFHIPREHTIAFGDSMNDMPMLSYADKSAAMGNSHPEVLKAASFVTGKIREDGIAEGMRHFGLL